MTTKNLAEAYGKAKRPADLTGPRLALLARTVERSASGDAEWAARAGEVIPFGTDWPMMDALQASGYIAVELKVIDVAQQREIAGELSTAVKAARTIFADSASTVELLETAEWKEALRFLNTALACEERLAETVWRITDKGREAVALYGG